MIVLRNNDDNLITRMHQSFTMDELKGIFEVVFFTDAPAALATTFRRVPRLPALQTFPSHRTAQFFIFPLTFNIDDVSCNEQLSTFTVIFKFILFSYPPESNPEI